MAPARRAARIASLRFAEDASEGEMDAFQRAPDPHLHPGGWITERRNQLVGTLIPLPSLADATMDDFSQVIAARQGATSCVLTRACASPFTSIANNCPT